MSRRLRKKQTYHQSECGINKIFIGALNEKWYASSVAADFLDVSQSLRLIVDIKNNTGRQER